MQDNVKNIEEACLCEVLQDRLRGWQERCGSDGEYSWRTVLFVNVQKTFAL